MKKFLTGLGVTLALAVCLTGCGGGEKTFTGEYSYDTEYGRYGAKVNVVVKGDVIDRVEIVESDLIRVTPQWEGSTVYHEGEQALLESFSGKTVSQVKGYTVTTAEDGVPTKVEAEGIAVVTGASQSTGRLVLAVQNALEKA